MPTDLNTAIDVLKAVQLKTRPTPNLHPIQLAQQIVEYSRELAEFHPDDVKAACKLWPRQHKFFPELAPLIESIEAQRHLRLARERRPGRASFDLDDPWGLPFGFLGIGLQVVRGQYLLAVGTGAGAVPAARRDFNRTVLALGLPEARRLADLAYRPGGDHEAVRVALEDACSPHGSHGLDIDGEAS